MMYANENLAGRLKAYDYKMKVREGKESDYRLISLLGYISPRSCSCSSPVELEFFSVEPSNQRHLSKNAEPYSSVDISQSVLTIHQSPLLRCPWSVSPRRFASLFATPASKMLSLR